MKSYKERLNQVTTFIFDVDGVFTNGEVLLMGNEVYRTLHSKDGFALQHASKNGYQIFIITGGNSLEVKERLTNLGAKEVHLKAKNKLHIYQDIKKRYQIEDTEILYMGDDLPDYPVLKLAGVATCPQDACPEVKAISHYQSPILGGKGCVRDVIEQTMKVQGKWLNDTTFEW